MSWRSNLEAQCHPDTPLRCQRLLQQSDEYVADLWDVSCEHSQSLFTALYMFTTIWFMELGIVKGFHVFPFAMPHTGWGFGQPSRWSGDKRGIQA